MNSKIHVHIEETSVNKNLKKKKDSSTTTDVNEDCCSFMTASYLVGALSPVNHKGLHQGWKQTSIHLLLITHKSDKTAKFFKIHKISLDTNTEHTNLKQILKK